MFETTTFSFQVLKSWLFWKTSSLFLTEATVHSRMVVLGVLLGCVGGGGVGRGLGCFGWGGVGGGLCVFFVGVLGVVSLWGWVVVRGWGVFCWCVGGGGVGGGWVGVWRRGCTGLGGFFLGLGGVLGCLGFFGGGGVCVWGCLCPNEGPILVELSFSFLLVFLILPPLSAIFFSFSAGFYRVPPFGHVGSFLRPKVVPGRPGNY